jgi:hypothetical protein
MQKDFITATPDSGGSGSTTVTATAPANQTESARSVNLSVAGGGMTRTVGASQAAGVVTWNYYFSVTPTSLSFVAGGETKSVTVTSYRKKVINGVETSTQENVNWTPTVSGTGFSVSGSNVTASANSATKKRSGTATYTQTGSGKTQAVSLSQAAVVITYKYRISPKLILVSNAQYGSVTKTVLMYKERYVNGVKDGEEQIEYSLLDQNGSYSPVSSTTYTNVWGGTWTIEKTGNSLKVTTISGGSNSSGGITGVRLMPGTSYAGAINTNLNLGRP